VAKSGQRGRTRNLDEKEFWGKDLVCKKNQLGEVSDKTEGVGVQEGKRAHSDEIELAAWTGITIGDFGMFRRVSHHEGRKGHTPTP